MSYQKIGKQIHLKNDNFSVEFEQQEKFWTLFDAQSNSWRLLLQKCNSSFLVKLH